MTDEDLARFLAPRDNPATGLRLVRALTPERRSTFERLAVVAGELNEGRIPAGERVDEA